LPSTNNPSAFGNSIVITNHPQALSSRTRQAAARPQSPATSRLRP
jgi:hypothetical protein